MIRIFRNIRYANMNQNRIGKYVLYAFGEIVLVMIGILLALQVNNWNEERKSKLEETNILRNINSELHENITIIKNCLDGFKTSLSFTDSLRTVIGPQKTDIKKDKINDWIGRSIGETRTCGIKTDVLESIRSSGDIKLISNDNLKSNISKWSSTLKKVQKEEDNWEREYSDIIGPFTIKKLAWDNVDKVYYPDDPKYFNSRFNKDNREVLMDFEFSNIVVFHHWRQTRIQSMLKELKQQTDDLSKLIESELLD